MSSERSIGSLIHEADQLTSVLFYIRNTIAITDGTLLYHKQPHIDVWYEKLQDIEVAHRVVQELYRYIEWSRKQPLPEQFSSGLDAAYALYDRKRSIYEHCHPERVGLALQPLGNFVPAPTYPEVDDYENVGDYYHAAYAESVKQHDAYRWMCDVEMCLLQHCDCDLMVPPTDSTYSIDRGWASIEDLSKDLMHKLLKNFSSRGTVSYALAEYGTDTAIRNLATLSDLVESYFGYKRAMARADREQQ